MKAEMRIDLPYKQIQFNRSKDPIDMIAENNIIEILSQKQRSNHQLADNKTGRYLKQNKIDNI